MIDQWFLDASRLLSDAVGWMPMLIAVDLTLYHLFLRWRVS